MTNICASCNRNNRLDPRRIRRSEIPSRARFEPTKKAAGSLELTPAGWVIVGPLDDAQPIDGSVS